jgi:glyoxylase-like metal-dependent hydrolase (beta-lactamase superfamily II)
MAVASNVQTASETDLRLDSPTFWRLPATDQARMDAHLEPNVTRLTLPFPDSSKTVSSYLVEGTDGHMLVDTGWGNEQTWNALQEQLSASGVRLADIDDVVLTHAHKDHAGLADRLRRAASATIHLHSYDVPTRTALISQFEEPVPFVEDWLRYNGVPDDTIVALRDLDRTAPDVPAASRTNCDVYVESGETIDIGPRTWELHWMPGHTPGSVVVFEPESATLLCGDLVLADDTPIVSATPSDPHSPLTAFLQSLERARELGVEIALPGHGDPIEDFGGRVDEIREHHRDRLQETRDQLATGATTAWEVAHGITWSLGRFDTFDVLNRNLALLETIAHLEHLATTGEATCTVTGDRVVYKLE